MKILGMTVLLPKLKINLLIFSKVLYFFEFVVFLAINKLRRQS